MSIINTLVLVGGGGHCRSCIEVVQSSNDYKIAGIIDTVENAGKFIENIPVIGTDESIQKLVEEYGYSILVTLGQIKSSKSRRRLFDYIKKAGGKTPVVRANTAIESKYSSIGSGTILMQLAIVNSGATIGDACIVNTSAIVEHDVIVGDFCHLSTRSVLNGGVRVGSDCFIGSGAIIAQEVTICNECIIGCGSVVIRSINEPGVYVGNPARRINDNR